MRADALRDRLTGLLQAGLLQRTAAWRWALGSASVLWLMMAQPATLSAPGLQAAVAPGWTQAAGPAPSALDGGWTPASPEPPAPSAEAVLLAEARAARYRAAPASRGEAPRLERRQAAGAAGHGTGGAVPGAGAGGTGPGGAAAASREAPPIPIELQWPIEGSYLSSGFGWRDGVMHEGIDLPHRHGHPILAAAAGTVRFAGWDGGYGYAVIIDHGEAVRTRYAHASKLLVAAGEPVEAGQEIALVGNTGHSYGNHLHFEVMVNGEAYNPLAYLPPR
jgi:murein DD-endopeptidase MepM/ murein hydrolase activator NlpD